MQLWVLQDNLGPLLAVGPPQLGGLGAAATALGPGPVLLRGSILRLQVDVMTLFFNLIVSLAENFVSNIRFAINFRYKYKLKNIK